MKLYEVNTDAWEDGEWSRSWEGTLAEAKASVKQINALFLERWAYSPKTQIKAVEVPTHKVGLLEFLNENCKKFS